MKKKISIGFSTIILFFLLVIPSALAEDSDYVRVIIGFHDEVDASLLEDIPHEVHFIHEQINAMTVSVPLSAKETIQNDSRIEWVENDEEVNIQNQVIDWGYKKTIDINTRTLNITGKGVKIGVIDTGIKKNHPDLVVKGGASFIEGTKKSDYGDENGHGTHVAGIIGAKDNNIGVVGVAPNTEIYSIKVLDKNGDGLNSYILAGLEWAIEHNIDIVNLSITSGYEKNKMIENMLKKVSDHGIIIVGAAGNKEEAVKQADGDIMYPARYSSVISVGSINDKLNISPYSIKGPSLDFVAPGENVLSTYINQPGNTSGYEYMSGTSMATPFVTGIIALYKENHPHLKKEQIKNILANNARDLGIVGKDSTYGYGLVQSPATRFWDTLNRKWYIDSVNYLSTAGYIKGFEDGSFQPESLISRGEVVTMIGRAFGLSGDKQSTIFPDVKKDYYASGYIAEATQKGWITGYPNNYFGPSDKITRADVAMIIQRTLDLSDGKNHPFRDIENNRYYAGAVSKLYEEEIITGYENGTYLPDSPISRAEFSAILSRAKKWKDI